ncbi:hypothetical protein RDABS01_024321 [Bienertia sinuspersici]
MSILFSAWEIEEICKVPIPLFDDSDKWMWHFFKDGRYTVKSAYNILMQERNREMASSSNDQDSFDWKAIWKVNLPPKVKVFAWRVLKNGIPVKSLLYGRGLSEDIICPMCGEEEESILHLLTKCHEVQRLWYTSPLRLNVADFESTSFKDWVTTLKAIYKESRWWDIFWSLCWGVWLRRNCWIFEKRKKRDEEVLHKAVGIVGEAEFALNISTTPKNGAKWNAVWKPPMAGMLKINTDAATFSNGVGLGGVTRDSLGNVVAATCMFVPGEFAVDLAKGMALRHALKINLEAGFADFVLEVDNMKLFTHLTKSKKDPTSFGSVVADICHLASLCQHVSYSFIKREGNRVAHGLAKLSCNFNEFRVWLEKVPSVLLEDVIADLAAVSVQ